MSAPACHIVELDQRTPEWHEWRKCHRMATESIPLLGVAEKWMPVRTPLQLFNAKVLGHEPERSQYLDYLAERGNRLEPHAMAVVERRIGVPMSAVVVARGDYGASLDGGDFGFVVDNEPVHMEQTAEVKAPKDGFASKRAAAIDAGAPLAHDAVQVQHQLMVSDARVCHYGVYDERADDIRALEITPDTGMHTRIRAAWDAFWPHVERREPPPAGPGDVIARDDGEWKAAVAEYHQAVIEHDATAACLKRARSRLEQLAGDITTEGAGLRVARYWRSGSIRYAQAPEVKRLDLEKYRGEPTMATRITETKA